jgi:hypothetical protein
MDDRRQEDVDVDADAVAAVIQNHDRHMVKSLTLVAYSTTVTVAPEHVVFGGQFARR